VRNTNPLLSPSVTAEKTIAILIALTCILTSTVILGPRVLGKPLSQEEAVEISRNTSIVETDFNYRRQYGFRVLILEIEHWNTTYIASIKQEYAYMGAKNPYGFLPDDHGVWKLLWSIDSAHILHWIDDLTGQIIAEESLTYDRTMEEVRLTLQYQCVGLNSTGRISLRSLISF
jgi:hypothetical protein